MRESNLGRLSDADIGIRHSLYLHYTAYHKDLFEAFNSYAKDRLLDIGCGNKPYLNRMPQSVTKYFGCDIMQSSDNCVDLLCPANSIPVESNSFDTVISTQTIEHVEDHQGLINEAYRALVTNGYFILSGPMYWPLHEEPYDFFRFTKHGLTYLLKNAGFKVIAIHANGGKWAVAGQALIHALYPAVYNVRGFKGNVVRSINWLFGGVRTINKVFSYIDRKNPDHSNTMNYVIVAQKQ